MRRLICAGQTWGNATSSFTIRNIVIRDGWSEGELRCYLQLTVHHWEPDKQEYEATIEEVQRWMKENNLRIIAEAVQP